MFGVDLCRITYMVWTFQVSGLFCGSFLLDDSFIRFFVSHNYSLWYRTVLLMLFRRKTYVGLVNWSVELFLSLLLHILSSHLSKIMSLTWFLVSIELFITFWFTTFSENWWDTFKCYSVDKINLNCITFQLVL